MILVKRDQTLIPEAILKVAQRAQEHLDRLPPDERNEFIKKKAYIWRSFAKYLAKMSYKKCWYSEAISSQSFFDVDHFRPKSEARRSETEVDEGYSWLAFDWLNYRFSAQRSNWPSKNETTQIVEGKSSWFPLQPGSLKASWENRCEMNEKPTLLDPTVPGDVDLVTIASDGRVVPSRLCVPSKRSRVEESVRILSLNLELKALRLRKIRDVTEIYETLAEQLTAIEEGERSADADSINRQVQVLRRWTHPDHEFSLAVRATLQRLGAADISVTPEEWSHSLKLGLDYSVTC